MSMKLNTNYLDSFISENEFQEMEGLLEGAHRLLTEKRGAGNDFLGWLDLPVDYDKEEFDRILNAAEQIKKDSDVLVVIGIGGSYLGARAVIEALTSPNYNSVSAEPQRRLFRKHTLRQVWVLLSVAVQLTARISIRLRL